MPRKSVVRLTDRPEMTLDVYRGRKTTMQQQPGTESVGPSPYQFCPGLRYASNGEENNLHIGKQPSIER